MGSALTAALVLLAVLQYRSEKAVSEATTAQMRASLQGSLMDVRQGLDRELTSLCREMQINDFSAGNDLQEYAVRFEQWRVGTTHPNLVEEVFIWQQDDAPHAKLYQFDATHNAFEIAEWPNNLQKIRERLIEISPLSGRSGYGPGPGLPPNSFVGQGSFPGNGPIPNENIPQPTGGRPPSGEMRDSSDAERTSNSFSAVQHHPREARNHIPAQAMNSFSWMIDQSVPALLQSFPVRRDLHAQRPGIDWLVIVLDRRVLGQHILPELVQRYFGRNEQSSYDIAVTDDDAQAPELYSSRPGFDRQKDFVPDAALNLFGRPVPTIEGKTYLLAGMIAPSEQTRRLQAGGKSGMDSPADFHEEGPFRLQPLAPGQSHGWEIIAKHREGSVEAAVATLSLRNLILNFAVLLVLAATMAMIIATTMRGRRLAQLQMDFVANVSHELRTPLTGIISSAQNIADGLIDDKQRVAHYGKAIISEAQQLSDLVEQILLFSATQKDRDRYHLQAVDVAEVLRFSLQNTSALIESAGVIVEQQIQPELPAVLADFKALSHCLQNLISNAVKYGGEARWVGIRAFTADGSVGQEVNISVSDRGIGIKTEDLNQIFEPFYRSAEVTTAQIHGSGLGLPLAKRITEAMGGRLTVRSEPGHGSTFTVHLPVK